MPSHLSLFELFMWQHQSVPQHYRLEIDRHLQSCPACADYVATQASFLRDLKRTASSFSRASPKNEKDCLSLPQLGMFVLNELREPDRKEVEKHCALCELCREHLVELFRAIALPLRENEQTYVANNPPIHIETYLRKILDLTEPPPTCIWKNNDTTPRWVAVPIFKSALGLAILFLLFLVGKWWAWPEFRYHSLVKKSAEKMSIDYPIYYLGDVRPSGDYHTTDIKEAMNATAPVASMNSIDEMLRSALAYKKGGTKARQILAQFYLLQENYAQADSVLSLLEIATPQDASVRNDRGLWHCAQNQYQAAVIAFEQAYASDPKLEAALYNLAIAQQHLGQIDAARTTWEKYLQLNVAKEWHNAANAQLYQLENP